jgi:hypothetical protein
MSVDNSGYTTTYVSSSKLYKVTDGTIAVVEMNTETGDTSTLTIYEGSDELLAIVK